MTDLAFACSHLVTFLMEVYGLWAVPQLIACMSPARYNFLASRLASLLLAATLTAVLMMLITRFIGVGVW